MDKICLHLKMVQNKTVKIMCIFFWGGDVQKGHQKVNSIFLCLKANEHIDFPVSILAWS